VPGMDGSGRGNASWHAAHARVWHANVLGNLTPWNIKNCSLFSEKLNEEISLSLFSVQENVETVILTHKILFATVGVAGPCSI